MKAAWGWTAAVDGHTAPDSAAGLSAVGVVTHLLAVGALLGDVGQFVVGVVFAYPLGVLATALVGVGVVSAVGQMVVMSVLVVPQLLSKGFVVGGFPGEVLWVVAGIVSVEA